MAKTQAGQENSGEGKKADSRKKIAGLSALLLWVLSIAFSFAIPPSSEQIWLPDAILLVGFFPLLWICPFSLVWLAFGILTTFIGAFLLLLSCIPDASMPAQSVSIKHHLAEYHPCWTWMILGLIATVAGAIKSLISLSKILLNKAKKQREQA
ncbi:MAG: hypothetical protein K2X27_11085 [Candidatus Obscuribacterales bacterium]|nr:hypothetical protein [Candidatus Obscuribacterales bacterium]